MAASYGARVLGEVTETRLDEVYTWLLACLACWERTVLILQFLHDLRGLAGDEQKGHLGFKSLDDALDVFMCEWKKEPVVEIASTASAAGKSQLLYYLAAIAVLPEPYGGRSAAVVYIDADGRFDANRLRTVAMSIAQTTSPAETAPAPAPAPAPAAAADTVKDSLQHVHVLQPASSGSLLATLKTIEAYLLDTQRHVSSTRPLHAILLDSATAFLWQDKLRDQIARIEEIGLPASQIEQDRREHRSFVLGTLYAELVSELRRLQGVFGCAVVYTATVRTRGVEGGGAVGFRSSLPSPWGLFPTLRVVVRAVGRGRFEAGVNTWAREDWSRRVVEGLQRINRGGAFLFQAGVDGLVLSSS